MEFSIVLSIVLIIVSVAVLLQKQQIKWLIKNRDLQMELNKSLYDYINSQGILLISLCGEVKLLEKGVTK